MFIVLKILKNYYFLKIHVYCLIKPKKILLKNSRLMVYVFFEKNHIFIGESPFKTFLKIPHLYRPSKMFLKTHVEIIESFQKYPSKIHVYYIILPKIILKSQRLGLLRPFLKKIYDCILQKLSKNIHKKIGL